MEELQAEFIAPKHVINDEATDADGEEQQDLTLVVAEISENKIAQFDTMPEETHSSTHNNDNGKPSPSNKSERRVYDRDFLLTLRDVPSSRIKPANLPDLDDALEYQSAIRGLKDLTFKDVNLGRHNFSLFPENDEFRPTPRGLRGLKQGMQEGRPRANRSTIILPSHPMRKDFELREPEEEIIKLRETDNPWRRGRVKSGDISKRDITAALYNRVRGILNKIMPQKVYKLGKQVKALNIHSQEQLQGVVDLLFEKAVDESKFVVAYALMCKELLGLEVSLASSQAGCDDVNFKKLIIAHCLMELEEALDKDARFIGLWDNGTLVDQGETESQPEFNEERKRFRIKFFGIIGFIGELFKQEIFESVTVHRCIRHLLLQMKDESLECLCKLFGSVGKDLESENETMNRYFGEMLEIVNSQKSNQIALRVRFMLQDVIELRANKWGILKKDTETIPPSANTEAKKKGLLLVCHQNDVQLREIDNPWRRGQQIPGYIGEGDLETHALHKTVQGLLNKLTPQKFDTLVNEFRSLKIDTQEKLKGVVDLVFDYAVHISGVTKPNYSAVCALMCKELAMMQVSGSDTKAGKEESNVNFRKLIITRCQMEFEKNTVDENARAIKMKEIEACPDPDKKKQLLHTLNEEERKIRVKSVGNITFIGELFKRGMLTTTVMHRCIRHLLTQTDEGSLECLCKLLSRIGKDLGSKGQSLDRYFKQILEIVNRKGPGKVSSRVRFMLRDVVELRLNKWVPRRDDSNPKTMDQIQKEAETKRLDTYLNNFWMNIPRKDDRHSDKKRNSDGGPTEDCGWSTPVTSSRTQYSVETSKLKNKPPPMDSLQIGNLNMFRWSRNVSADAPKTVTPNNSHPSFIQHQDYKSSCAPTMTEEQLGKTTDNTLEGNLSDIDLDKLQGLLSGQLSMEQIKEKLLSLMSDEKEYSFNNICAWISANVGERAKEPQFIRVLMTAILEVSIKPYNQTWKFKAEKFQNLQTLIYRYIDTNDLLELNCLIAIQEYIHKLEHPSGVLLQVIEKLSDASIVSDEAFLAWESNKDPTTQTGKSVAMLALTSFFTSLKEAKDDSTSDEA